MKFKLKLLSYLFLLFFLLGYSGNMRAEDRHADVDPEMKESIKIFIEANTDWSHNDYEINLDRIDKNVSYIYILYKGDFSKERLKQIESTGVLGGDQSLYITYDHDKKEIIEYFRFQ